MNLADAIRRATARSGASSDFQRERAVATPRSWPALRREPSAVRDPRPSFDMKPVLDEAPAPEPPAAAVAGGNAIRLEIFLSGEQMTSMLKAIMAGQHSVLTLREAASYLRIGSKALERLIEDGEIPALEIDGKYRFQKTNLDDWMAMKTATTEETKNVA